MICRLRSVLCVNFLTSNHRHFGSDVAALKDHFIASLFPLFILSPAKCSKLFTSCYLCSNVCTYCNVTIFKQWEDHIGSVHWAYIHNTCGIRSRPNIPTMFSNVSIIFVLKYFSVICANTLLLLGRKADDGWKIHL